MIKNNLPVILLRGLVLLPNNEIRLEFDNDANKSVLDMAELFHDNNVLVVSQKDPLEEVPDIKDLPKIGVVAKITHKMELPNGKTRVIITGIRRASIYEYLNLNHPNDVMESIVTTIVDDNIEEKEESVLVRKVLREVESYVKQVPYVSNSVLSLINNIKNLSKLTDVAVPYLPLSLERMHEYLTTTSSVKRAEMILEDIYKERELFSIEKDLDSKVKQSIDSSQKEYLLREKMRVIKEELGDLSTREYDIGSLREKSENLKADKKVKDRLNEELKRYESLNSASPEINIVRNYIDWLLDLPWKKYTRDNADLTDVKKSLDETHYGLDKVKERIIEYLAVKKMTNSLRSPIICLVGPPGVGKTSLAFSIASAMHRNFVKVSVGGINDEAEIVGHRRTYLGANPGRIIQSLKKANSSNPVFLIDEIDKMTKDYKGDPASCLLEVLDPEQNKYFSDNYIEEEFDLSKVMFIATANYIENIPEPLRDRLEIVELSGYTEFEKLDIAKRHLVPKVCKENGLKTKSIIITDDAILKIIREYTKEAGVRELERKISSIVRKYVKEIVMENKKIHTITIDELTLDKYLGKPKYTKHKDEDMPYGVVNGLAYTQYGGDILPIEVTYFPGKGELVLTGSLGDVMKESARIALSYIKAHCDEFNIKYQDLMDNDVHIHVPEGAVPKDGPSAGITLTTALISAFTKLSVDDKTAMTGEITLRGTILPIGGLKEKSIGAHRNGIKRILIPYDNINDLDDVPKEVKKDIEFIPIKQYTDVVELLFKENILIH